MAPIKQPPKRATLAALKTARHWLALNSDLRGRPGEAKKMRARLERQAKKIALECNRRNPGLVATADSVLAELDSEASRLGPLTPLLGKDM